MKMKTEAQAGQVFGLPDDVDDVEVGGLYLHGGRIICARTEDTDRDSPTSVAVVCHPDQTASGLWWERTNSHAVADVALHQLLVDWLNAGPGD